MPCVTGLIRLKQCLKVGGIRHDLGNPAGFIPASVEFGLRHPKYDPALFRDLEAIMEKYRPELG